MQIHLLLNIVAIRLLSHGAQAASQQLLSKVDYLQQMDKSLAGDILILNSLLVRFCSSGGLFRCCQRISHCWLACSFIKPASRQKRRIEFTCDDACLSGSDAGCRKLCVVECGIGPSQRVFL
ncbi:hypothetical protein CDAR_469121 [Caerostris darwini]|uniref:Secreted protein n=1 Tax=Caerostris darwini TaxID=1538125 RepID=A0AAV4VFL8_9ARAC|nr:hypothetical protein CDAR_469121 [Caerostris darwini]